MLRQRVEHFANEIWYGKHPAAVVLAPLSGVYRAIVEVRRRAYAHGVLGIYRASVPVIVVGNLTAGGTGKTPLVIWLAGYLKSLGHRPGVLARGYGGRARHWPQQVRPDSDARAVGDEAIVIARRARCPVCVGPDRRACAEALVAHADCDILISDDGLQHYALDRDVEIAVIDGVRRYGNGRCLPAGPLREPLQRVRSVDMVVTNGIAGRGEFAMKYVTTHAVSLARRDHAATLEEFASDAVHAVAGIGNPDRFFSALRGHGLRIVPHPFPDHHVFKAGDLAFDDERQVLMTEKDAVKCEAFATNRCWAVPVTAELPEVFATRLEALLARGIHGQATS
ncbi:MAG: tetraacyldisaccharide 4'-kinase [Gammaproteobacteria bacterium]